MMTRFGGSLVLNSVFVMYLLAMACASAAPPQFRSLPADPPNVLLILADDLAWGAVGYNGSFIRTPNIDRIAGQGVQLTRFYVSPMCSPTRAGLMTGRYPMRYGMARSVVRPWAAFGLPPQEQTLAEALAAAGYRHRGVFGKWHLGHLDPTWHPLSQGFTEFVGQYNGAADYWTRVREGEPDWHQNDSPLERQGYTTELIAEAACEFIKRHAADGPFFCYVPFTAPHEPLQAPQEYLARYTATQAADAPGWRDRRTLAAMVTCMDTAIGQILQALRDGGITDKTIVWFISDNGGVTRFRLNGPWREGKLTVYEGGVRVPSAVYWPGVIEGGRKVDEPVINLDVMPTLLRIAGHTAAPARPFDGVDISDLLTTPSAALPARDLYFFTGQAGLDREQIAVLSAEGWKLVVGGPDIRRTKGYRMPGHRVELFNLSEDPGERRDLAAEHPDLVKTLGEKLVAFRNAEPPHALAATNEPPPGFKPPRQWRNRLVAPTTQAE